MITENVLKVNKKMLDNVLDGSYNVLIAIDRGCDEGVNGLLEDIKKDIAELVSAAVILSSEDRAVLLCSANALKTRKEIEEARKLSEKSEWEKEVSWQRK